VGDGIADGEVEGDMSECYNYYYEDELNLLMGYIVQKLMSKLMK
jgi:hypothetical protein